MAYDSATVRPWRKVQSKDSLASESKPRCTCLLQTSRIFNFVDILGLSNTKMSLE